eukprot:362646-Prorocentrum_minimum.AAC.5
MTRDTSYGHTNVQRWNERPLHAVEGRLLSDPVAPLHGLPPVHRRRVNAVEGVLDSSPNIVEVRAFCVAGKTAAAPVLKNEGIEVLVDKVHDHVRSKALGGKRREGANSGHAQLEDRDAATSVVEKSSYLGDHRVRVANELNVIADEKHRAGTVPSERKVREVRPELYHLETATRMRRSGDTVDTSVGDPPGANQIIGVEANDNRAKTGEAVKRRSV